VHAHEGGLFHVALSNGNFFSGHYVELVPDKKVIFRTRSESDTDRSLVTVTIASRNGGTQLALVDESDGADWLKSMKEIEAGWNEALDNLVSTLGTGIDLRVANRPMLGMEIADFGDKGMVLSGVVEGTGAQAAGLSKGDVVQTINGVKMASWTSVEEVVGALRAGDKVKVSYTRAGQKRSAMVELSPRGMPEVPATPEELGEVVSKAYVEINKDLAQILRGVSDEKGGRPPRPGDWSAKHVLAHLIVAERELHTWVTKVVAGVEDSAVNPTITERLRLNAVINAYPTLQALLQEFKRNQAETVALINALSQDFVDHKASYYRTALVLVSQPAHTREHLEQIKDSVR
jgi:membrane-associated protease RseP (regulator of RpoE activity)